MSSVMEEKAAQEIEKKMVHNHLLDTEIYATLGDNNFIQTRPSVINFHGFEVGRTYRQKLSIINASTDGQRLHIIPPMLDVFNIQYSNMKALVPGACIEVTVEFKPNDASYQTDSIRIHTKASCNLIIPIHAYMVMDVEESFPSDISFKSTVIGQKVFKQVLLKNPSSKDFVFRIIFSKRHEAFQVEPSNGVVPARDKVHIKIFFSPLEYVTACAQLQVSVSHFNNMPFYCSISGSSQPGISVQAKLAELDSQIEPMSPRNLSPLERSRAKKLIPSALISSDSGQKEIIKNGIRFPLNLNNATATAYVLSQQPGKIKTKELFEAIKSKDPSYNSPKLIKDAIFEHTIHENRNYEEKNKLRWCVRTGDDSLSLAAMQIINKDRENYQGKYSMNGIYTVMIEDWKLVSTSRYRCRVIRTSSNVCLNNLTFDKYLNDEWRKRHMVLKKFIQAARKVIVKLRASRNIRSLNKHLDMWRKGNFMSAAHRIKESLNIENDLVNKIDNKISFRNISSFSLPVHYGSLSKDDATSCSLDNVDLNHSKVKIKLNALVYNLKVTQQYKLLSYKAHQLARSYVSKLLPKPLKKNGEATLNSSTVQGLNLMNDKCTEIDPGICHIVLMKLLSPPHIHPLRLFNPSPGIQAHHDLISYSAVNFDNRFCALPKKSQCRLHQQDVISGSMSWKNFSCQGLLGMNTISLGSVFVPRWSDPFSEDMMSSVTPCLLNSLEDEDVMDDKVTSLSPLALNSSPTYFGYVSREKQVSNLNIMANERTNDLGSRMASKVESILVNYRSIYN